MAQHWLYPVNDAKKDKQLSDGKLEIPRTPDGVREAFRRTPTNQWILGTAFRQVKRGDRLWIYVCHPRQEITAVANVVHDPTQEANGTWSVRLQLDWAVSNYLVDHPIARTAFRQVPYSVTRANPATVKLLTHCERTARTAPT